MSYLLLLIVVALAAFNIYASRLSLRSEINDRAQKWAQLLLIWLVPALGAFLTIHVLKGPARRSWLGRGRTMTESGQAGYYPGDGDDCRPGDTGYGE